MAVIQELKNPSVPHELDSRNSTTKLPCLVPIAALGLDVGLGPAFRAKVAEDGLSLIVLFHTTPMEERVGDHAKDMAEQIIYVVKGTDVRHNPIGTVETLR